MIYTIYNKNGVKRTDFDASQNCTHVHKIQTENVLNLSFTLPDYIVLDVNDYIDIDLDRYTLTKSYKPLQKSTKEWAYEVKFDGAESVAAKAVFVGPNYEPITAYYDTPSAQLAYIVKCINRVIGSDRYHVGAVVNSEPLLIDYQSGCNCLQALDTLSKALKTEWWLDATSFNLTKCEHGDPIELAYGQGLLSLSKDITDNLDFYTRLIPRGSSKNIVSAKYGHSTLQLPGGAKYVDREVSTYGIVERFEEAAFADIYPRYIGTVSAVRTEVRTIENVERTIYYIIDNDIPFDPSDYELPGKIKHVAFKSGDLVGQDFEANYTAELHEWELILQYPTENMQLPGGNVIPRIGDTYTVYNISMPEEYYPAAEQEFEAEVNKLLDEHAVDYAVYKAPTDHVYLEQNGISLRIGSRVKLLSNAFFDGGYRDSRITRITRKLSDLNDMDIEVSNTIIKSSYAKLKEDVSDLHTTISQRLADEIINVVRSYQLQDLTDDNVMSSTRTLNEIAKYAIAKNKDDEASGLITFLKGLKSADLVTLLKGLHVEGGADIDNLNVLETMAAKLVDAVRVSATNADIQQADIVKAVIKQLRSAGYTSGPLGSGLFLGVDEDGNTRIEVDNALIRKEAIFNKLTIAELQSVGGQIVLSIANMECLRVDDTGGAYRCYFDNQNGTITNKFKKYDQARCQTFDGKKMKYYWRLVVGVGADYIDLSKTDSDGTSIPEARDSIVQLGNRVDASRQNAIILSAYGTPSIKQYDGIHSYSLDGCEVTVIGPEGNKFTGDFSIISGGKKVRIPADLGEWNSGMACQYYDRVSYNGALWLCLVEEGITTTSEPRVDNPIWQKQVSEGGTGYRLESFTTMGYEFYRENQPYNHTLSVRVFWNEKDTTESINPMRFKWTRVSENTQGDTVWNERHSLGGNSIDITSADLAGDTSFRCEFLDISNNNILTKTF